MLLEVALGFSLGCFLVFCGERVVSLDRAVDIDGESAEPRHLKPMLFSSTGGQRRPQRGAALRPHWGRLLGRGTSAGTTLGAGRGSSVSGATFYGILELAGARCGVHRFG